MLPIQSLRNTTSSFYKQLLPAALLRQLQCYRRLTPHERYIYAKLQCLRRLRSRAKRPQTLPTNIRCILFLCHGNVIRSPMAAALLKQHLKGTTGESITVISAGLDAFAGGMADPRSIVIAREFGLSLEQHSPQPLTAELVDHADLIFVMDFLNQAMLLARYPCIQHKVFLLGQWTHELQSSHHEIRDPYDGDMTDIHQCYTILQTCIRAFAHSHALTQ